MLIADDLEIKRVDKLNICLFRKVFNKKKQRSEWRNTGHYWSTFEKAIVGIAKLFGPESISFAGDVREVVTAIQDSAKAIDMLYKKILSRLDSMSTGQIESLLKKEDEK